MGMAIVTLSGNVGGDPEVSKTRNGEVMNFSLAVNLWRNNEETTDWYRCVTFTDYMIDRIEKAGIEKGTKLVVYGRLQMQKWEDREGAERITPEVLLQDFDFGGAAGGGGGRGGGGDRGGGGRDRGRDDRRGGGERDRDRGGRDDRERDDRRGSGRSDSRASGRDDRDRGGGRDSRGGGRDTRDARDRDRGDSRGRDDAGGTMEDDRIPF